jgi:hypothetical protein
VRALLDDVDTGTARQQVLLCQVDGFKYEYKVIVNFIIIPSVLFLPRWLRVLPFAPPACQRCYLRASAPLRWQVAHLDALQFDD